MDGNGFSAGPRSAIWWSAIPATIPSAKIARDANARTSFTADHLARDDGQSKREELVGAARAAHADGVDVDGKPPKRRAAQVGKRERLHRRRAGLLGSLQLERPLGDVLVRSYARDRSGVPLQQSEHVRARHRRLAARAEEAAVLREDAHHRR